MAAGEQTKKARRAFSYRSSKARVGGVYLIVNNNPFQYELIPSERACLIEKDMSDRGELVGEGGILCVEAGTDTTQSLSEPRKVKRGGKGDGHNVAQHDHPSAQRKEERPGHVRWEIEVFRNGYV